MSKINFLKRLTYRPEVSRLVWRLRLAGILRQLYYWLNRPPGDLTRVEVGGLTANFYVRTPWDLRSLESAGGLGHEQHILELLVSKVRTGDVVYDIGSNFGIYTILLAKGVGPSGVVIAVEPERQSYNQLQENVKLNALTNVRSFNLGLGDQNGEAKLFLGEVTGASSLVKPASGSRGYKMVKVIKGDHLVKKKNLSLPRLVKIDVEGSEYAVIRGLRQTLTQPSCEIVCCEIHPQLLPTEIKPKKISDLLKSLGFNRVDIYPRGTIEYHILAQKKSIQRIENKNKVLVCAFACLSDPDRRFKAGGEGVLGWNIVKQLARFHQLFVLTHSQNRSAIEKALKRESLQNVKFYYIDLPNCLNFLQKFQGGIQLYTYLWQIRAYFFARKLHQKFHFDIFHHVTYANDWMASFIGALLKIPYIRGPGGGAHRVPKSFLSEFSSFDRLSQYLRSIGQWFFRHDPFFILSQKRAKTILVCNRESLEKIPKKWQDKTSLFSVNGISTEDLDLLSLKEKSNDKFRVLSAGKLFTIKGFNLAIKAFKIFSDKVQDAELEIIGDGPEFRHLKNLAQKLKIQNKVQFKKWVPRNEFLKELINCDVFLFPSLRDGGGAVVVEAMAAGKPVICLDIAGPGFHISNERGIKIKPYSPEQAIQDIANALERLYKDRELRYQMGRAARKRAEEVYHWDRLGDHLLRIYQEVLKL